MHLIKDADRLRAMIATAGDVQVRLRAIVDELDAVGILDPERGAFAAKTRSRLELVHSRLGSCSRTWQGELRRLERT